MGVEILIGKTLTSINVSEEEIIFTDAESKRYRLCSREDYTCDVSVTIEDICGDLNDLIGSPILIAEETSNNTDPPKKEGEDSFLWTFYRFATTKGFVTIRWYGRSNGYYSEKVDFIGPY